MRVHSFRLDDDLYMQVLVMSEVDGITVSELVRAALNQFLHNREKVTNDENTKDTN
jgi:predicted transcriptional regulator